MTVAVSLRAIALALGLLGSTSVLGQQLTAPLRESGVAVTGFAGTKLATPSLPPGVDPNTVTVIGPDGEALRIIDLTLGGPTPPMRGQLPAIALKEAASTCGDMIS